MSNATLDKFGYPDTVIEDGPVWTVLLRPAQVTLGSLVLVCKEPVQAFSELSKEAFADLHEVTGRIERSLHKAFSYDKINYLMLMMVDPDVHFHVIPRYAGQRRFADTVTRDAGWPGPPELGRINDLDDTQRDALRRHLISLWG
ncbi:MAG: HIT family protein [Geoalkalibacter sp.]|uniref:HIT family protein n=1 Tax=Geoalkalibacter sp. TaxID=3041440 RepID=UPI002A9B3A4E|nr:HIT family protein [Thermodesulfobacteriota bacterium]